MIKPQNEIQIPIIFASFEFCLLTIFKNFFAPYNFFSDILGDSGLLTDDALLSALGSDVDLEDLLATATTNEEVVEPMISNPNPLIIPSAQSVVSPEPITVIQQQVRTSSLRQFHEVFLNQL